MNQVIYRNVYGPRRGGGRNIKSIWYCLIRYGASITSPSPIDAHCAQPWRRRTSIRERRSCEVEILEPIRVARTQLEHTDAAAEGPPSPLLLLFGSFYADVLRFHLSFLLKTLLLSFDFSPRFSVDCARASFQHHGQSGQQHGAVHGVRSAALSVRPVLRYSLQCHLPGWGERLGGQQAAERHRAAESSEEHRGYDHSHIHHGSVLRHLRGGTSG